MDLDNLYSKFNEVISLHSKTIISWPTSAQAGDFISYSGKSYKVTHNFLGNTKLLLTDNGFAIPEVIRSQENILLNERIILDRHIKEDVYRPRKKILDSNIWGFDAYYDYEDLAPSGFTGYAFEHGDKNPITFTLPEQVFDNAVYGLSYVDPITKKKYGLVLSEDPQATSQVDGYYKNGIKTAFNALKDNGFTVPVFFRDFYNGEISGRYVWSAGTPDDSLYYPPTPTNAGILQTVTYSFEAPLIDLLNPEEVHVSAEYSLIDNLESRLGASLGWSSITWSLTGFVYLLPNKNEIAKYPVSIEESREENGISIKTYVLPRAADLGRLKVITSEANNCTRQFIRGESTDYYSLTNTGYGTYLHDYSNGIDNKIEVKSHTNNTFKVPFELLTPAGVTSSTKVGDTITLDWTSNGYTHSWSIIASSKTTDIGTGFISGISASKDVSFTAESKDLNWVEDWLENPTFVWGSLPVPGLDLDLLIKANVLNLSYSPLIFTSRNSNGFVSKWRIDSLTIQITDLVKAPSNVDSYSYWTGSPQANSFVGGSVLCPGDGNYGSYNQTSADHPLNYGQSFLPSSTNIFLGQDLFNGGFQNQTSFWKDYIWKWQGVAGDTVFDRRAFDHISNPSLPYSLSKPWTDLGSNQGLIFIPRFKLNLNSTGDLYTLDFEEWEPMKLFVDKENPTQMSSNSMSIISPYMK